MNDISVINLFLEAGLVVKIVMMILLIASLLTWIVIVERYNFYKKIKDINSSFHKRFWSGEDLNTLFEEIVVIPIKNSFKDSVKAIIISILYFMLYVHLIQSISYCSKLMITRRRSYAVVSIGNERFVHLLFTQ